MKRGHQIDQRQHKMRKNLPKKAAQAEIIATQQFPFPRVISMTSSARVSSVRTGEA
jgi:hypothetical protein